MHTRAAAALLASLAIIQAAGAQGDGTAAVAEELRQLREQLHGQAEEASRASEALFWSSFLVGACIALVAVAGTACSVVYLRRHVGLLRVDAHERLRPALARTECFVSKERDAGSGQVARCLVFEITNVGAVAAVGVMGHARYGVGASADNPSDLQTTDWSIGALAPGSKTIFKTGMDARHDEDADEHFWFELTVEYKAIGGRSYRYHATCVVRGDRAQVTDNPIIGAISVPALRTKGSAAGATPTLMRKNSWASA